MESKTLNIEVVLNVVMKKLGDTYFFIKRLGGGEFSNVYLVKHRQTGQELALKLLDYHYLLQKLEKENQEDSLRKFDEIKKRFLMEAKLYEKIQHPNIVQIHDTGFIEDPGKEIEVPYMVMSYIKGASLAEIIRKKGALDFNDAVCYSRDVLGALQVIHQNNIVHRDLKPANIMIDDESGEAVIIDFGISKDIVAGTRLTNTGAILGSPVYMAPEQFIDSRTVGPAVDIYAYGAVLYEMLTGVPPFEGSFVEVWSAHRERPIPDPRKRNPHLPAGVVPVLARAMAKEPDTRFRTPEAFLKALEEFKDEKQKSPFMRYLLILAVVSIIGILLFSLVLKPPSPQPAHLIIFPRLPIDEITETARSLKPVSPGQPEVIVQIVTMNEDYNHLVDLLTTKDKLERKLLDNQMKSCRDFLSKYQKYIDKFPAAEDKVKATGMFKDIQDRMKNLEMKRQILPGLDSINKLLLSGDYESAKTQLENIKPGAEEAGLSSEITLLEIRIQQQKTDSDKIHGTTQLNLLKERINLENFLKFQEQFPGSKHLEELVLLLKKADPHLPPPSYWSQDIRKNNRGYYELTFGDVHNGHHMIYIPGKHFWIDKYEISNLHYRQYLLVKGKSVLNGSNEKNKYIHQEDEYPAVVTMVEAEAYCREFNLRLPRHDEWEYLAGKNNGLVFPWGNEPPGTGGQWQANCDSISEDGKELDQFKGTAPVKSFENFSSPFGCVNMVGNVWEWTQGNITKGGSFLSMPDELTIVSKDVGSDTEKQGFRCIKEEKK